MTENNELDDINLIHNEWQKKLGTFLKELKIIREGFTGKIDIDFNQGGIGSLNRTERLK